MASSKSTSASSQVVRSSSSSWVAVAPSSVVATRKIFSVPQPATYNDSLQDLIFIERPGNTSIPALFCTWKGGSDPYFHILYSHDSHEDLGTIRQWLLVLAETLRANVLCYEYRGYGLWAGDPTEYDCYEAINAAWKYLTTVKSIPPHRVILMGKGLGAGPSLYLSARMYPSRKSLHQYVINKSLSMSFVKVHGATAGSQRALGVTSAALDMPSSNNSPQSARRRPSNKTTLKAAAQTASSESNAQLISSPPISSKKYTGVGGLILLNPIRKVPLAAAAGGFSSPSGSKKSYCFDNRERAARTRCQTLLIHSSTDPTVPPEKHTAKLAASFPHVWRTVAVAGAATHDALDRECSDDVLDVAIQFIDALLPTDQRSKFHARVTAPLHMSTSPQQIVTEWLKDIGMVEYATGFLAAGVFSLMDIATLTEPEVESFGVQNPEHRQAILIAAGKLKTALIQQQ